LKEGREEEAKRNTSAKFLRGLDWALFFDWGGLTIVVRLFTSVPQEQTIVTTKTLNKARTTMRK
jgi:hypothetical protein